MFEKIDISFICRNHFKTLYNASTGTPNAWEITVFYVLPVYFSILLVGIMNVSIKESVANLLVQAFAVVGGLLINARFILVERRSLLDDSKANKDMKTLIEETSNNTSFGIIVCFLNVIVSVFIILFENSSLLKNIFTIAVISLTTMFFHSLLMILRRLEGILED